MLNRGGRTRLARTIRKSRRPRQRANAHSRLTSRGSSTARTVASRNGSAGSTIRSSTAELPSQRSVVRRPRSGRPRCSQRSRSLPIRMLRCVPSANHNITNRIKPIAIDGPNASSGGIQERYERAGSRSTLIRPSRRPPRVRLRDDGLRVRPACHRDPGGAREPVHGRRRRHDRRAGHPAVLLAAPAAPRDARHRQVEAARPPRARLHRSPRPSPARGLRTQEGAPMPDDPRPAEPGAKEPKEPGRLKGMLGHLREVTYGMAAHDMTRHALRTRASMEHLFILTTMGDMLGVPILPPYYSLRLLPYAVPQIATWKRRMLREKDLTDAMF